MEQIATVIGTSRSVPLTVNGEVRTVRDALNKFAFVTDGEEEFNFSAFTVKLNQQTITDDNLDTALRDHDTILALPSGIASGGVKGA